MTAVVGEKEKDSDSLAMRVRFGGTRPSTTLFVAESSWLEAWGCCLLRTVAVSAWEVGVLGVHSRQHCLELTWETCWLVRESTFGVWMGLQGCGGAIGGHSRQYCLQLTSRGTSLIRERPSPRTTIGPYCRVPGTGVFLYTG